MGWRSNGFDIHLTLFYTVVCIPFHLGYVKLHFTAQGLHSRAVNRNNSDSDFEYNSVFRHLLDSNSNYNSKPLQIPIQMNSFTD